MRLWSVHPKYLDPQGLVALWREALLAQAVISGRTRGYRRHPQLARFLATPAPRKTIAIYLRLVHEEATRRGYRFDGTKIGRGGQVELMQVTRGQLDYEWAHLRKKLARRSPEWLVDLPALVSPEPHPLFRVVAGDVADWEVIAG